MLLLVQGGGVITYFEDHEQQSQEHSKAEDAATAASGLPSRPPHRARYLQSGNQDKLGSWGMVPQASFIVHITSYG